MKKVKSKEIPDDVAFSILSKLSLKSLKRFTCVRKSWALLLENPYFMSMFRTNFLSKHQSHYDDTSLLLLQTSDLIHYENELYLVSGNKFENRVKLDWPHHLAQGDDSFIRIFGFCIHGTFCVLRRSKLALWNPATTQFRIIPSSPLESPLYTSVKVTHGFGYDSVRDDFKIIRSLRYYLSSKDEPIIPVKLPQQSSTFWEIYSLRSNSWRKLDVHMPVNVQIFDMGRHDMYMNGVCHWFGTANEVVETKLVSFNLSNEVFLTTPLPSYMAPIWVVKCLMALNGSIAVISGYAKSTTFHLWILGELGVKESWTKLFIVGPLQGVKYPIGAGKKSDIFFRKEDNDLVLYDLNTQTLQEIASKRELDRIIVYKKSILPIGRAGY